VGERVELCRYSISDGERVLYGQRIKGVVRITDRPADEKAAHTFCSLCLPRSRGIA
jgi:hypothetical protein